MRAGIDLSLRSTGIAIATQNYTFKLVKVPSTLTEEGLLIESCGSIMSVLKEFKVTHVNLEGLSHGSKSSSKDVIAGNFWILRCAMHEAGIEVNILPVSMWRAPLFNSEERKEMRRNTSLYRELKKIIKLTKTRVRKMELVKENIGVIEASSIKIQTFLKCPEGIKKAILAVTGDAGRFDLSDAYFLSECNKKLFTSP
jgi:hypothetical protein